MKILDKIDSKSKKDILKKIKEKKILIFFRVYQQFIKCMKLNKFIYMLIVFVEYFQLIFEITNDNEDYVKNNPQTLKKTSSFKVFKFLQYINFSHFITPDYLSLNNFLILYIFVVIILIINFFTLITLDYLDKKYSTTSEKSQKLSLIHAIIGCFNFINLRILIFPTTYVLVQSYFINSYKNIIKNTNKSVITINHLTTNQTEEKLSEIWEIIIYILSTIILISDNFNFSAINYFSYYCVIIQRC